MARSILSAIAFMPAVVEVEMVAGVVGREDAARAGRVADDGVEVHDRVEEAARADHGVDLLAYGLTGRGVGAVAAVRGERRPDDADPSGVCAAHDAAVRVLEGGGSRLLRGALEVVDALHHDHHAHAGAGEDVGVEAGQCAGPAALQEEAVSGDTRVEDAEPSGSTGGP